MADRKDVESAVERLLLQVLASTDLHLVDVEYLRGKQNLLRIYIHRPSGVTLEDCEQVSRQLGELLDRHEVVPGSYRLEVSSPGLERVIRKRREYELFRGRLAKVTCKAPVDDQKVWHGVLLGTQAGCLELESTGGRRVLIPLELVSRAQLVFSA